jgi:hypothetical protein
MQPVSQFDENDTNIGRHGKNHLTDIFCLALLATGELHPADFCYSFDNIGRFFAKEVLNFIRFGFGILQRVMKEPSRNAGYIHLHFGENVGDLKGMG